MIGSNSWDLEGKQVSVLLCIGWCAGQRFSPAVVFQSSTALTSLAAQLSGCHGPRSSQGCKYACKYEQTAAYIACMLCMFDRFFKKHQKNNRSRCQLRLSFHRPNPQRCSFEFWSSLQSSRRPWTFTKCNEAPGPRLETRVKRTARNAAEGNVDHRFFDLLI